MTVFFIEGMNRHDKSTRAFKYDNTKNILTDQDENVIAYPDADTKQWEAATVFDSENPLKKSKLVTTLKIQLGLSCNYECTYCSQRFVPRAKETNPKQIENFLKALDNLEFSEQRGLNIEFWGGEPLVYWKTLKPLAEALYARFDLWKVNPRFSIITNGSILSEEICDWLVKYGFFVSISHDGPGQSLRGPDPLDDPNQKKIIMNLYKRLKPINRISFNSMMHKDNLSRKKVYDFFVALTGDKDVLLGEGGFVDAYDDGGIASMLPTKGQHFQYRQQNLNDILETDGKIGFMGILNKTDNFVRDVLSQRPAFAVPQKCGMDDENVLSIDLNGNVITCQNVSTVAIAPNSKMHMSGNIRAIDKVQIKSSRHWSTREDCAKCPLLHLCKGSCMYLEGERWDVSCDAAYTDNVVLFALAFEKITGYVPVIIRDEAGELPLDRQDVWGIKHQHDLNSMPSKQEQGKKNDTSA